LNSKREEKKLKESFKHHRRVPRGFSFEVAWNGGTPRTFNLRDLQVSEKGGSGWTDRFRIPRF
jgi:hypothetical protein